MPDGQISRTSGKARVQPFGEKYFAFAVGQIKGTSFGRPASNRGAYRDRHERGARDAVAADRAQTSVQFADGEAVWS